ncbi:hypothetical protein COL12_04170 [Bacillus cereus]|nr:hypothetical protein COL12_04170 [Bacillus cereus]
MFGHISDGYILPYMNKISYRITCYVWGKVPLYNGPGNTNVVAYVARQNVTVILAYFLINTSLGQKWIGYNV